MAPKGSSVRRHARPPDTSPDAIAIWTVVEFRDPDADADLVVEYAFARGCAGSPVVRSGAHAESIGRTGGTWKPEEEARSSFTPTTFSLHSPGTEDEAGSCEIVVRLNDLDFKTPDPPVFARFEITTTALTQTLVGPHLTMESVSPVLVPCRDRV